MEDKIFNLMEKIDGSLEQIRSIALKQSGRMDQLIALLKEIHCEVHEIPVVRQFSKHLHPHLHST